ncbi:MAG TPA: glycosyltransferase family 4 protein [Coxiellaceae bacterium]|nr:glycosyltransferase family 4 protein [Coxiellaceae bacterium]
MRVLHFYKTYFPDTIGGVEQVINQLARGSANLGVESEVLSLSSNAVERTIEINGHKAHRARCDFQIASTSFSASVFLRFAQLAKKADVIHYHFPWPFMDVVHFATRVKKPSLVTYHSDIIRQKNLLKLYRPLQKLFLSNVDQIVATSPNYLATSHVLEKFVHKVAVIPIGLDKASYPEPRAERLAYWHNQFGERFFLFVGVIRYYKGLHILLEAAQTLTYPIVIVGSGPVENELKAQAQRLGLSNIHFLGQQPEEDKVALLSLCYAVLFPSHMRSEAFGVSLLEGAMFGKPMISSEIGTGTTFVNIADETGVVVPPGDPIALRQAMKFLWQNPVKAELMGKAALRRYHNLFTAEKMVNSYLGLYQKLVNQKMDQRV